MQKKATTGALIAAALIIIPLSQTRAADVCDFKDSLKQLSEARAASRLDDSAQNVRNELSARKASLGKIIDCAVEQASNLKSEINSVQTDDQNTKADKNRLVSRIDEINNYYQLQKNLINDLGLEGSKMFSANLKTWRESNYAPIAELGNNFMIFVKNQEILQTTQNRFNQISLSLRALGLSDSQRIRDLLNEADKNMKLAQGKNSQAGEVFKNLSWPNDVSDLMALSLVYLKEAYQNFFDIGEETGKIMSDEK